MTLGEKLKEIRKRLGLSQEELAELINVSRQAITKWENDNGIPDISNLQELSKTFGITMDYFLDNEIKLPLLVMRKEINKTKYQNKIKSYAEILKEYYKETWEVYTLIKEEKMNKLEWTLNLLTGGYLYSSIKDLSDLSPYYLIRKDNLNLLINIKNWVLEVHELPNNINTKKFSFKDKKFINIGKLNLENSKEPTSK